MKSNYNQLGQYIEMVSRTNSDLKYGIEDVRGCSNTKQMMQTRANLIGRTYEKFIVLRPQEFVFNRRTTRNGEKIGMAYNNTDREYIFTNDYVAFRVKQEYLDKLLPDYLYLFFCRDEFDRYARYKSTGSATEFFNWEDMCAVPFEIPPMDFQQLIVNAYKVLNERIATKQKINDNLTEQCSVDYSLMLNGYTTESEDFPNGWSIGSIGSYCDVKSGFAFKSDWWTTEGYKVIKIANIVNNTIDLDNCDCVKSEHANKAQNFYVQSGDILIAMTGATTGKIGIVPLCNEPIVVNQRVGKFFLGEKPIEKAPFLYSTLIYSRVIRHLQPDGTAGSAQDNLSADNIKDIAIVLPEQSVIDRFNQQHIPHIKAIMSNCAEIRMLNRLAETVLQTLSSR